MAKILIGPEWTATGKGKARRFHHPSGWVVFHCGHPTALWPWGVYDPEGRMCTSGDTCRHGFAFRLLQDAINHVEGHLAGRISRPA